MIAARVGAPPVCTAWTMRRAEAQPMAAKKSGFPPTRLSHWLKRATSGTAPASSPAYMAVATGEINAPSLPPWLLSTNCLS